MGKSLFPVIAVIRILLYSRQKWQCFAYVSTQEALLKPTLFYDAELRSVSITENSAQLTVAYLGRDTTLPADPNNAAYCRRLLETREEGKPIFGLARLIQRKQTGTPRSKALYRFDPYVDQTLRRAFDLDAFEFSRETHNANCVGWRNAKYPDGFLAPKGLIPGQHGRFVSSSTQDVPVAVPLEFFELCVRMKSDPETVLKSFIADICNLNSTPELPRADGSIHNGVEARRKAREYLRQAWRLKKDFFS